MAILFAAPFYRATDLDNAPIAGAFIGFFKTQTSTPQPIYADAGLTVSLTNPLPSDGNGVFPAIWLDDALPPYKFVIYAPDQNDITIPGEVLRTGDPCNATISGASLAGLLNPQTLAEINAAAVPSNYFYTTEGMITPFRFGAVGDGLHDDTAALQKWLTVLGQSAQTAFGFWGRGTFLCSANLVVPANVYLLGAGSQSTILKPTAGVTIALTTSAGVKLHGLMIDGVNTTKATGLLLGPVGPDYNEIVDVLVQNFIGASASTTGAGVGIVVQNVVSLLALRMFAVGCNTGMVVQSTTPQSLPTTCIFQSCRFRASVLVATSLTQNGAGVRVLSGQQITFRDCIYEVNGAQGLIAQATTTGGTGIVTDLRIQDSWFEDNYHAHVDTGTNVYSLHVDGATGSGVNLTLSNLHMTQGAGLSDRKSILLASTLCTLDKIRCFYGFAHEIVVTGGSNSLVYVVDDSYDRCGRFINSSAAVGQVLYPAYLPIMDLGTGASILPTIEKLVALTYSASMTPDLKNGNSFNIQLSNTTAFTINNPLNSSNVQVGKRMSIRITNVSGNNVPGAVTWGSAYKVTAPTQPQNNFSLLFEFEWDGAHMVECYHSPVQVPV